MNARGPRGALLTCLQRPEMRAITVDPTAPRGLTFADVPEPVPTSGQAVLTVHATSLNFGEVTFMAGRQRPGHVAGNDAAGVIEVAAADGSGPPAGTRVAAFADAAALPTAATTALRALRGLGAVVGRRVLVTGASGGVGRFAVQLCALAGAHVVAAVGRPERGEGLRELGAGEVVVGLAGVAPVWGVLERPSASG